jgi:hypothetical protein
MDAPHAVVDPCFVVGHVRDPEGRPIAGAQVTALPCTQPPGIVEASTGFDGWFSIGPLAWDCDYVLCVAPIPDAGWTTKVPLHVPADQAPADVDLVAEVGRTVVIRFHGIPVADGDVEVRLLREDRTVAALSILEGVPPNYDVRLFGRTRGGVGVFRELDPGKYLLEAETKRGPLPGTPTPAIVTKTAPCILSVGDVPPDSKARTVRRRNRR